VRSYFLILTAANFQIAYFGPQALALNIFSACIALQTFRALCLQITGKRWHELFKTVFAIGFHHERQQKVRQTA
jgi:hypothetical protein